MCQKPGLKGVTCTYGGVCSTSYGSRCRGPGGFQPYEVMRFVRHLGMAGAGAFDITEYARLIDANANTGNIIATLYCEFMAGKAWYMQQAG